MNGRERTIAALSLEVPDRIPHLELAYNESYVIGSHSGKNKTGKDQDENNQDHSRSQSNSSSLPWLISLTASA